MYVADASTLILMTKVDLLHIFIKEIGAITIPLKVLQEITKKPEAFETLIIQKEIGLGGVKVAKELSYEAKNITHVFKLDGGEAAAYLLWKKIKAKAVLTDDWELIKVCKIENAPFICAMAIPVMLKKLKKLTVTEAVEKIGQLYSYGRYGKSIKDYFEARVRENGNGINTPR